MASVKYTRHEVDGRLFGGSSNAVSRSAFSLALLSLSRVLLLGAFLTALFAFGFAFGFGPGLAFAFFATGLLPTFALPPGVFGPGFLVAAALVVLLAGVRPVCAFGRPAGFPAAEVAYVRVASECMRPNWEDDKVDLPLLCSDDWSTRASHGLYPNRVTTLKLRPTIFVDRARCAGTTTVILASVWIRSGEMMCTGRSRGRRPLLVDL